MYPYEILEIAERIYPEGIEKPVIQDVKPIKKRGRVVKQVQPVYQAVELLPGWEGCHVRYRENTFNFIKDSIVRVMADQRAVRGLPRADVAKEAEEYQNDLDPEDRKYLRRIQRTFMLRDW